HRDGARADGVRRARLVRPDDHGRRRAREGRVSDRALLDDDAADGRSPEGPAGAADDRTRRGSERRRLRVRRGRGAGRRRRRRRGELEQPGIPLTQEVMTAALEDIAVRDDDAVEVPRQYPLEAPARRAAIANEERIERGWAEATVAAEQL